MDSSLADFCCFAVVYDRGFHLKKKPQLSPGLPTITSSKRHPFCPRSSQKAAPCRQVASPVACS